MYYILSAVWCHDTHSSNWIHIISYQKVVVAMLGGSEFFLLGLWYQELSEPKV